MTNSRLAAVKSLSDILGRDRRPKQSLDETSDLLDKRDRAFVMEVVYGVLRNLYALDRIISLFVKDVGRLGSRTHNNLRASIYQIFFMNVPGFAAVNEAVEAEKSLNGKPSLVNAVLRNILRGRDGISLSCRCDDPAEEISLNTSHPEWMVRRWISRFGADNAKALAEANNSFPGLTIRANSLRVDRDDLLRRLREHGIDAEPAGFSPDGIRLGKNVSFGDLADYKGMFMVQDEASQLICHLLSPQSGEKVLDACAAPGGKTAYIAELMKDSGEIVAADRDDRRLMKLKENISAIGIRSVSTVHQDASSLSDVQGFDRILLDAPCSSTGVIRRNPDVRYRHTAKDLLEFGKTQLQILRSVSGMLRPGGRLVYSVCSTEPEEGEMVVSDFLKTSGEFRIIETVPVFMERFMTGGFFRTFPDKDNMDGFFGVILCRKR